MKPEDIPIPNVLKDIIDQAHANPGRTFTEQITFDGADSVLIQGYIGTADTYIRRVTVELLHRSEEMQRKFPGLTYLFGRGVAYKINEKTGEKTYFVPVAIRGGKHPCKIKPLSPWDRPGWED